MNEVIQYWIDGWEHDMFFWSCAVLIGGGYKYHYPVLWRRIHDNNTSMHEVKTLEKRRKQVSSSLKRPAKMRELIQDHNIVDYSKNMFLDKYEAVLKRRNRALQSRNILLALYNLFRGRNYYLHKEKGALLDIVLIVFGTYKM